MSGDCLQKRGSLVGANPMTNDDNRTGPPLIELRDVDRVFDDEGAVRTQALADVSLVVEAGEFVCITGPSGSGKSTLLNILGCLDRPTAGAYRFAGRDVTGLDAEELASLRRDEFGFVFQAFNLLESATARQNVELPARYAGLGPDRKRQRAAKLLKSLGLGERLDHRPVELSGGERQRVSIARALMNGGRVILADEPTGALDSVQSKDVLSLLKELAAQGHTVVMVSHDPAVAASTGRRIELRNGRLAADSRSMAPEPVHARASGEAPAGSEGALGPSAMAPFRDALWSLGVNPLRTALAVLSVAVGVGSVVALLSLAEGIERKTLERVDATKITIKARGKGNAAAVQLAPGDAAAIRSEVENVRRVFLWTRGPLVMQRGAVSKDTDVRADTRTRAIAIDQREWPLAHGAFLTAEDSERREQVVVLGPTAAEALFERGADAVGEHVQIAGIPFLVKGVLEQSPLPVDVDLPEDVVEPMLASHGNVAYVPFYTGLELLAPHGGEPETLVLGGTTWTSVTFGPLTIEARVADAAAVREAAADIRDLLIRRHGREGFDIDLDVERVEAYDRLWQLHPGVQAGVAAVALAAGLIGMMATLLVSVGARRREVGIRMAVGARRRDIASQFLAEAAVAAVAGGAFGLLLGYWTGVAVAEMATPTGLMKVPVAFAGWFAPVALGCAVAMGLASGIVPARRAARLDPVGALAGD